MFDHLSDAAIVALIAGGPTTLAAFLGYLSGRSKARAEAAKIVAETRTPNERHDELAISAFEKLFEASRKVAEASERRIGELVQATEAMNNRIVELSEEVDGLKDHIGMLTQKLQEAGGEPPPLPRKLRRRVGMAERRAS